jgi:hypothetical protein
VVTARQRHVKHVSAAADTDTIQEAMFSMWPLLGNGAVNTLFGSNESTHNNRGNDRSGAFCVVCAKAI